MWRLLGGIFLGWGVGSNDFANIFGTGVCAGLLRYRTAVILGAGFLLLGALAEGPKCMAVVGSLTALSMETATICTVAAALVLFALTYWALPASASQAIVGAIVGVGLYSANQVDLDKLFQVLLCWLLTPVAALFSSIALYKLLSRFFNRFVTSVVVRRTVLTSGVVIAGCYGAYSFGANNVANVTGVYAAAGMMSPFTASLVGGVSMALGGVTYSYRVMETVGKRVVPLDPFSAFVATLANAATLHLFTQVGIPVSSTQAVVGAVAGVGLIKDFRTVSNRMLLLIAGGWLLTPLAAGLLTVIGLALFHG